MLFSQKEKSQLNRRNKNFLQHSTLAQQNPASTQISTYHIILSAYPILTFLELSKSQLHILDKKKKMESSKLQLHIPHQKNKFQEPPNCGSCSVGLFFLAPRARTDESIICKLRLPLLVGDILIDVGYGNLEFSQLVLGKTTFSMFSFFTGSTRKKIFEISVNSSVPHRPS